MLNEKNYVATDSNKSKIRHRMVGRHQTRSLAVKQLPMLKIITFALLVVSTIFFYSNSKALAPSAIPPNGGFADLVDIVNPAVVNISTITKVESNRSTPKFNFPQGSPFDEWFKKFYQSPNQHAPQNRQVTSLGSGFLVASSGYVVTNNHVISKADMINVILQDGTELEAKIIGRDEKTDLAVLKVEHSAPLPFVKFGDSDVARVGDWVVAVGNPFGLGGTVTAGIISARGRDIQSGPFDDFLQIDAPINRGNSGGPLFNSKGEVIGINTAIFSPSGGSVGIGFAIPSNMAETIISSLQENGVVNRGWLGVVVQPLTHELAQSFGIATEEQGKNVKGALIAEVVKGGPAEHAGLEVGDIILEIAGESVKKMRDLPKIIAKLTPNKKVDFGIWRNAKVSKVNVMIGQLEAEKQDLASVDTDEQAALNSMQAAAKLGMTLGKLDEATKQQLKLDENQHGVLITSVKPGSIAFAKGIRGGDVILKVDGTKVESTQSAIKAIQTAFENNHKFLVVLLSRKGQQSFIAVPIKQA